MSVGKFSCAPTANLRTASRSYAEGGGVFGEEQAEVMNNAIFDNSRASILLALLVDRDALEYFPEDVHTLVTFGRHSEAYSAINRPFRHVLNQRIVDSTAR